MSGQWSQTPPEFQWRVQADILFIRALAGSISDESWSTMLADLRDPRVRIVFALSFGAQSISAAQRKATADVMQERDIPAIVIADNRFTRGVLTAISWLGANIQSFPWNKSEDALARLDPPEHLIEEIRQTIEAFRLVGNAR